MPQPPIATTIDEVIEQLDKIIADAVRQRSRLGLFAALYRIVTVTVKEGIAAGRFEDGPRMERFDVTFANRYLAALEQFQCGVQPAGCWRFAFETAATWPPLILQQLLLGMNAHINFDLGIAAAETCPGDQLPGLRHDFDEINAILAGLVGAVQSDVDKLSPWIRFLGHIDPKASTAIVNFSMDKARTCAWGVAERLAPLGQAEWQPHLDRLDLAITALAQLVRTPIGVRPRIWLWIIRLRENNDVAHVVEVLNRMPVASGKRH